MTVVKRTLIVSVLLFSATTFAQDNKVLNLYSSRHYQTDAALYANFTRQTGIKVNRIEAGEDALIERIRNEGERSPADVLVTVDAGRLWRAEQLGFFQPVKSTVLDARIPANYREPGGHWFGFSLRARVIAYNKVKVKAAEVSSYESLADPKWKGRVCMRSAQHPYNVALVASMIATHGEVKAETWLSGLKANLARKPAGGDREAVRDVNSGLCDLAIGNTYYMGAMETNQKAPEQQLWAASVKVLFPNAADRGTHVNISGAALAANAPNREQGIKLIEYLASGAAQQIYAEVNFEYPVVRDVAASARVQTWGALKADPRPIAEIAQWRRKASELIDRVHFDQGS